CRLRVHRGNRCLELVGPEDLSLPQVRRLLDETHRWLVDIRNPERPTCWPPSASSTFGSTAGDWAARWRAGTGRASRAVVVSSALRDGEPGRAALKLDIVAVGCVAVAGRLDRRLVSDKPEAALVELRACGPVRKPHLHGHAVRAPDRDPGGPVPDVDRHCA